MQKPRFPQLEVINSLEGSSTDLLAIPAETLPSLIRAAGTHAERRFLEFFTAHIRNPGTRAVYGRAVGQFCRWCEEKGVGLKEVSPFAVAAYIELLTQQRSAPTVKLHLAAILPLA